MKILKLLAILLLFGSITWSCSDTIPMEERTNLVKYVVYSDSPGTPMRVYGVESPALRINNRFEAEYTSKGYFAQLEVRCDDINVLLTCEIYVNHKLKSKHFGNGMVVAGVVLKGNPQ